VAGFIQRVPHARGCYQSRSDRDKGLSGQRENQRVLCRGFNRFSNRMQRRSIVTIAVSSLVLFVLHMVADSVTGGSTANATNGCTSPRMPDRATY
jgi:hypothetical protein